VLASVVQGDAVNCNTILLIEDKAFEKVATMQSQRNTVTIKTQVVAKALKKNRELFACPLM